MHISTLYTRIYLNLLYRHTHTRIPIASAIYTKISTIHIKHTYVYTNVYPYGLHIYTYTYENTSINTHIVLLQHICKHTHIYSYTHVLFKHRYTHTLLHTYTYESTYSVLFVLFFFVEHCFINICLIIHT